MDLYEPVHVSSLVLMCLTHGARKPPGPPTVTGVLLTLTFALSSSIFLLSPLITFHPLWGYPGSSGSYRTIVCSGPY